MSVEFETEDSLGDFTSMNRARRGMPRVDAAQTKIALGVSATLMLVATLFIWLKVGNPPRPYIDHSELTPPSADPVFDSSSASEPTNPLE